MTAKVKRKLTTIFCADVQNYSKLMEADEPGTLATLQQYRHSMGDLIAHHDGRVVNTWGDAVIAEFPSVIGAVQCAIDVQRDLAKANAHQASTRQMRFRIGLNLGDVMIDGDDIYGEGVNVAARLQEVAEPGGIAISKAVFEQVRHKLTIGFDYLGEQTVKNVTDPVSSYRVLLDRRNAPAVAPEPDGQHRERAGGSTASGPDHAQPPRGKPGSSVGDAASPLITWDELQTFFFALPKSLQAGLALVVFLFSLNVFSGISNIWFHWAAAPILFVTALHLISRRNRAQRHKRPKPADAD